MKKIIVLAIILTLLSCGESSKSKRKSFVPKWKNGQELCFMDKKVIMTTYNWSNDCIVQWVDNNGDIQTEIMLETSLKICE